ncbi:MAG: HDOD domain-containing protein [Candidatus Hydrogenedentes bacterium]|nr:HDOD domain-containing protein [Candidatus Hydrogenedentota bacterium]
MINRDIVRKLLSVENFPTLPEVMSEILRVSESEDASASELTALIEQDHAISLRVLRMANSAFYGLRSPVHSIRNAVVVLGFSAVRLLALTSSVFDSLARRRQFALDPTDFWMHSLGTAKAAQFIASSGNGIAAPDVCFTAGLVHDVGKYVLALALKDEYRAIVERSKEKSESLWDVELASLGITSAEVGGWLTERWRLPASIVLVITNLHGAETYTGANNMEVAAIALADQISRVTGFGFAGDFGGDAISERLVHLTRLTPDQLSTVQEKTRKLLEETRRFIGLMKET